MTLETHFLEAENALAADLRATRAGINDTTGKGSEMEQVIEQRLILPHLPPGFGSRKGAVISSEARGRQSPAIDRVIYNRDDASPIVYSELHSIFPIEAVAGVVEITMNLDATKMKEDIQRMAPVKEMRKRRFLVSMPGSATKELTVTIDALSPRSFMIALPSDPGWQAKTIADALRRIQLEVGGQTHVHGLYVIGTGFFQTIPIENDEAPYRIRGWLGPDRLYRFTSAFRHAFDRWSWRPPASAADIHDYVSGLSQVLAE